MNTEAALLREVSRVQHDKTLQMVRDLVEQIGTTQPRPHARWDHETEARPAKEFRAELVKGLQRLREAE